MRSDIQPDSPLLTPAEVAALFRVDPKTVTRWAQQGKLRSIRTLGGHRRYREAEVQEFLHRPAHQGRPGPRSTLMPAGSPYMVSATMGAGQVRG
jgi:excisionase family DNA binding protein